MSLETASFFNDLVTTNPVAGDNVSQGDDHIRLLKTVMKGTFPNLARAIYLEHDIVDLASATTPDLSTPASNYINITGTTQIDGFATEPAGFLRLLRFNAALTLNYNATSLILPTGDDILTEAGDHALAISKGSGNWEIAWFARKSGKSLTPTYAHPTSGEVGYALTATGAATATWQQTVPPGATVAWPTATAPSGWLECDGTAVSRTAYAALFAVIGDDYGAGDGTTTFNLPDYRGEFLRGWDHGRGADPDAADRTSRGDGTTGDNIGTKQADLFETHIHGLAGNWASDGSSSQGNGAYMRDDANEGGYTDNDEVQSTGGDETRPRNVNVMWIIKT